MKDKAEHTLQSRTVTTRSAFPFYAGTKKMDPTELRRFKEHRFHLGLENKVIIFLIS